MFAFIDISVPAPVARVETLFCDEVFIFFSFTYIEKVLFDKSTEPSVIDIVKGSYSVGDEGEIVIEKGLMFVWSALTFVGSA